MSILVTYASKHGSTRGIAERIARQLQRLGAEANLQPIGAATDPGEFRAMVIGSAIYYGSRLKEAAGVVRGNRGGLAPPPGRVFPSGPPRVQETGGRQRP